MSLELSPRQKSTVAAAVTVLAAVVLVGAAVYSAIYIGRFFGRFSNVFLPLAVAAVGALVLKPFYDWIHERLKLPPVVAVGVVFLSLLVPVAGIAWFFGAVIADQVGEAIQRAPQAWDNLQSWVDARWPAVQAFWNEHPWGVRIRQALASSQEQVLESLGLYSSRALTAGFNFVRAAFGLLSWVVLPVYLGFFLMVEPKIPEGQTLLPFLKPQTRDDVVYLLREFVEIMVAFFRGQLLIALLQGILFAIGFSIVGLRYGLVLGLLLGFLNIIPYLGSIVGLAVALPLAMWQEGGGIAKVIAVLVVFTVVQMVEGYLLTPRIMGNQTGLHPVAIILAVFFWGSAMGGITGMVLAIPLTAFLVSFWRLAREKYITELV